VLRTGAPRASRPFGFWSLRAGPGCGFRTDGCVRLPSVEGPGKVAALDVRRTGAAGKFRELSIVPYPQPRCVRGGEPVERTWTSDDDAVCEIDFVRVIRGRQFREPPSNIRSRSGHAVVVRYVFEGTPAP